VFTISQEDGLFLRDTLGFDAGGVSLFPIRINPADSSLFEAGPTGFSSQGPNNDFAVVKPDTTAPGEDILMGTARVDNPNGFASASGTSFSGPHVAGAAALVRDPNVGRPGLSSSQVRAALMNSATNLRQADGVTPVPDDDDRTFIHSIGAGLIAMVRATSLKAVMGTNELNGGGGPDDPRHPDFLPSFSFGERPVIGTNLPATAPFQQARVTVSVADLSGAGGSYTLSVVDGGALRGDVTRPLNEPGFSLSLSQGSVFVPANGRATFDVHVAVDGTANGLQIAGRDDTGEFMGDILLGMGPGAEATEFLWYVVATPSDGTPSLRMPFYYRAVRGVEGGGVVGVASGGGWIPSGGSKDHFSFQAEGATPATGEIRFDPATGLTVTGSVAAVSVDGHVARFSGPCTLKDGTACEYSAEVEDNANPGRGADRFTLRWTTASGDSFEFSGLLGGGNIQVRTR
jgi:hypothetical protein